jgi:hypothetical protein
MEQARADNVIAVPQQPDDWSKLIRKLRWIDMEGEAQRLQLALRSLPPDESGTVSAGSFNTD